MVNDQEKSVSGVVRTHQRAISVLEAPIRVSESFIFLGFIVKQFLNGGKDHPKLFIRVGSILKLLLQLALAGLTKILLNSL